MKSLFPYQGGKSKVADIVWSHFKGIKNYIEPFCGSAAVLFNKPDGIHPTETINDLDGFITNLYRSIKYHPEETAHYADWPVSELDVEARHHYLCKQYAQTDFVNKMRIDEEFCDPKSAGYWVYGACIWIGCGWCADKQVKKYKDGDPEMVSKILSGEDYKDRDNFGKKPHLGNKGTGINREDFGRLPHLGDKGTGINRERFGRLPLFTYGGTGINRDRPEQSEYVCEMMDEYCDRLRKVRICCGDWARVTTPSCTFKHGLTGIFLDPPYSEEIFQWENQYGYRGKESVWADVIKFCEENEDNKELVIALCGHDGDWKPDPDKWQTVKWVRRIGYSKNKSESRFLERIWISNSQKPRLESYSLYDE